MVSEFKDHYDRRSGDTPIIIWEVMQGVQGIAGPRGERGIPGPPAPAAEGPPAPAAEGLADVMISRLEESEAIKMAAKQKELEDEVSRMRQEQALQARTGLPLYWQGCKLILRPYRLSAKPWQMLKVDPRMS